MTSQTKSSTPTQKNKTTITYRVEHNGADWRNKNGDGLHLQMDDFRNSAFVTPTPSSSGIVLTHDSGYASIDIFDTEKKSMYYGDLSKDFSWRAPNGKKIGYVKFGPVSHFGAELTLRSVTFEV